MSESGSVKLPTFNGKVKNFTMFWMQFKAYRVVKGFLLALQDGGEANMPVDKVAVLDLTDPDEKKQHKAKREM